VNPVKKYLVNPVYFVFLSIMMIKVLSVFGTRPEGTETGKSKLIGYKCQRIIVKVNKFTNDPKI